MWLGSNRKMPTDRIKYLLREQVEALLGVIDHPRDRAIFTLAYWRGLRASEVGRLKLVDWKPSSKRLYVSRAKGSNPAEYLLSSPEVKALQAWMRDRGDWPGPLFPSEQMRPISRFRLHQLMRQYGVKAGIPVELRHFHALRHSIAVHLSEDGRSMQQVQDWLGHRAIESTARYARLTNKARDKVAEEYYRERQGEDGEERPTVKWKRGKR